MELAYLLAFIPPVIVVTHFRFSDLQVARLNMRGTQTREDSLHYGFFPGFAEMATREFQ